MWYICESQCTTIEAPNTANIDTDKYSKNFNLCVGYLMSYVTMQDSLNRQGCAQFGQMGEEGLCLLPYFVFFI